ncbi:CaiB/BaiF CoA transferase family protein [Ferrimicrobium acidiphilum]|uniref:Succinyl-CoA:(R)-benzylsuccinate CoA-transferase subunit BbsF n=1 Tax=Ferrimicrobium acidiphilum DSM 19497 TaxID=1121877 RepID=A0A0D8FV37_9ACTN|nr:CoA transferase [Ferrimicrobium acidiphilum]KJE77158.1 succinyl-CoA:(R)-benzylsuccinate CoA-transferase subunit BbsF [Ferrimicrobium acidiphilum DSM 19497]
MKEAMALEGLMVLEFGQLVAAPSAGRILADFGAKVIKVEPPDGDPLRHWGEGAPDADSWWWYTQARNKRLISIDLKTVEGRGVARELAKRCDILIENLLPGRLEAWHLGYDQVVAENPSIIYASISGFGQSGPYRDRAGFGNIAESMGGIRYITGFPDRPPLRTGVSVGDELAALQAVIGILTALHRRNQDPEGHGDFVDVALTEAVLSITEGLLPEYLNAGLVQERTGNQLLRAAPSNIYPTADERWIAIGANTLGTFGKLAEAMGRPDLKADARLSTNEGRVEQVEKLDADIAKWTQQHELHTLVNLLAEFGVPAGPVMDAEQIAEDPQIQDRDMIQYVSIEDGERVGMLNVVPRLTNTPGQVRWAGGRVGQHTNAVLSEVLEYPPDVIDHLRAVGAVR